MESDCYTKHYPRFFSTFFVLTFFFSAAFAGNTVPEYDEALIIKRLKSLDGPIDFQYNSVVQGYLKSYLVWHPEGSARIIGRSVMYYPIFEAYLKEYDLPEMLKYLSVVESALDPHATSPVGAVGLWQFMPETGKEYGLIINKQLDERKDPHKSTKAAMEYLSSHYKRYEDWALTLAAYNSGSGRVSRAIKRGRSKNFWTIRKYLPRETRNYVPAYIAASYLMEFYQEHEIVPVYPELDFQITETVQVYSEISFEQIAQVTALPIETIQTLNPAYKQDLLPENEAGNYLILPQRAMEAFKIFLQSKHPDMADPSYIDNNPVHLADASKAYEKIIYTVKSGATLESIAKELNCSVHQIKAWNKLPSDLLQAGQKLTIFQTKSKVEFAPLAKMEALPRLEPALNLTSLTLSPLEQITVEVESLFYTTLKRETLREIAKKMPHLSFPDLLDINDAYGPDDLLKPGTVVKLPK